MNKYGNTTVYINTYDPKEFADPSALLRCDDWAQRDIKMLETLIEELKQYRKELYDRQQELVTTSYKTEIKLKREKRYNGKVNYFLTIARIFEDGTTQFVDNRRFEGTARHTAITQYEELCKAYPCAEHIKDIEKGKWE